VQAVSLSLPSTRKSPMTNAPLDIIIGPLDEDAITAQLVRLIGLCDQHDIDIDRLMKEAQHIHSGEPDVQESG
jgi:hypothetical protein